MTPQLLLLDTIADEGIEALRAFAVLRDARGACATDVLAMVAECDGLIVKSGNRVDKQLMQQARRLRVIGRAGSGLDNIDTAEAKARDITILTSPEGNACSVAEYVLCAALLLSHRLHEAHQAARHNDFRRAERQGRNLAQLSVGVVGAGHIGQAVAHKLAPLCRNIVIFDPYARELPARLPSGVTIASDLGLLLRASDVVSLHAPLTEETRAMLGPAEFAVMRRGVLLINSGRGALLDSAAFLQALASGVVAAAALDVLDPEPPFHESPLQTSYSHPLIHHPKVYYTPHIAAGTRDALREVATSLAHKLADFFARSAR